MRWQKIGFLLPYFLLPCFNPIIISIKINRPIGFNPSQQVKSVTLSSQNINEEMIIVRVENFSSFSFIFGRLSPAEGHTRPLPRRLVWETYFLYEMNRRFSISPGLLPWNGADKSEQTCLEIRYDSELLQKTILEPSCWHNVI